MMLIKAPWIAQRESRHDASLIDFECRETPNMKESMCHFDSQKGTEYSKGEMYI